MKVTMISHAEWKDYYRVQQSGTMNMWHHPNIEKFSPRGNYKAAHKHFVEERKTNILVIRKEK